MHLRDLVDTNQLLFIVKEYYSLEQDSEGHAQVRPYLLLIMKAYFTKVRIS